MSARRYCPEHGEWVDDGTTDDCPECIAERSILKNNVVALRPDDEVAAQRPDGDHSVRVQFEGEDEARHTDHLAGKMGAQALLVAQLQQPVVSAAIEEVPDMGGQVVALLMENGAKIFLQVGAVRIVGQE